MVYHLNPDVLNSGAAPIPAVVAQVTAYRQSQAQQGQPLIHLAPGHPSHAPHPGLVDRVAASARDTESAHYGLGEGVDSLRKAIVTEMKDLYADNDDQSATKDSVQLSIENVVVTLGANQAIYLALQTLARTGDEVILCEPYFFNMHMALEQLGINPVKLTLDPDVGFLPSPKSCQELITPKTKAVMLVSPSNPTGAILPSQLLESLALLARRNRIALILDETYRDLLPTNWEGHEVAGRRPRPHSLFGNAAQQRIDAHWTEYLIHVYSFSKSFAVPGYRLGALVASPKLLEQTLKIIDTQTICPAQTAQAALAWAIPDTLDWRNAMREDLNERLKVFSDAIHSLDGWSVTSAGAFYAWVKHPFEGHTSAQVVQAMISQCGVSALPGDFFASADSPAGRRWMRFSVPNVPVDVLRQVGPRLAKLTL